MKPFDLAVSRLYLSSGPVWEFQPDLATEPTLGLEVGRAWREAFGEAMPELPEPFDMEGDDRLYIFPHQRYLLISTDWRNGKEGAEIRETMPLFFLHNEHGHVRSSFQCKTRILGIERLLNEILPNIAIAEQTLHKWVLFERSSPGSEPVEILRS